MAFHILIATQVIPHPVFDAPASCDLFLLVSDLQHEDLPADMSLCFNGNQFRFRTREERLQFALGIEAVLNFLFPND